MNIEDIKKSARAEIQKSSSSRELEGIRVKYLGRKGQVALSLRSLKDLSLEERRAVGPKLQALKKELEELIAKKLSIIDHRSSNFRIDLTAPGKRVERGHLHPLTQAEHEIRNIFLAMNFSAVEGPEVESEYYNFDALNFPSHHPAREMHDTIWLKTPITADRRGLNADQRGQNVHQDGKFLRKSASSQRESALLLRTHVSGVQVRHLQQHQPPFQIVYPGRCFRFEATDISHETNFIQFEAMMTGKDITLANFKFVVETFLKKYLGNDIDFRYRPAYFPFVEPGLEVIVKYRGKWLEIMGAGMVHPHVFEYAGYNPRDWQGFAFGMGLDRLALVKHNIPDIRLFYSGDLRFVRQF